MASKTRSNTPTPDELRAAIHKTLRDVIAPGLDVLFCGINPGLYSAATGWHFARPGNRFWPALQASGFTAARLHPSQRAEILAAGIGITNLVARATAGEADLTRDEIRAGAAALARKVRRYRPCAVAVVGIGAYRLAFAQPRATFGRQPDDLEGAMMWVLPNTSGLNANHSPADFARAFGELREAIARGRTQRGQR
jgi:TDG/mug DNA glycosylase family protein